MEDDLYIAGGTAAGAIMIPNRASFKKYCQRMYYDGDYYYLGIRFKNNDLILLDFPAYFILADNIWCLRSKESLKSTLHCKAENLRDEAQCIDSFLASIDI